MNFSRFSDILYKYQALLALAAWGALSLLVLNPAPYGLDEMGAKSLSIVWSIIEGMTSLDTDYVAPAILDAVPDLRVLWFFPAAIYWPENLLAVKIFIVVMMAISVYLLYRWAEQEGDQESALLGSGLLLISPLTLFNIDGLHSGPFILLAFTLAMLIDRRYRAKPEAFGVLYFLQLFLAGCAVSMHPAGLALPLALVWHWHHRPVPGKHSQFFIYGLAVSCVLVISIRMGWPGLNWFDNPMASLSVLLSGQTLDDKLSSGWWMAGALLFVAWIALIVTDWAALSASLLGRTLLIATVIGLPAADITWALFCTCLLLYRGIPALVRLNRLLPGQGFFSQRGIVSILVFGLCLQFMLVAKTENLRHHGKILGSVDQLIFTVADLVQRHKTQAAETIHLRIASQWPGRTLLACKCFVAALPPAVGDAHKQLDMLGSITHLIFDPNDPANRALVANFSQLSGTLETADYQKAGVLVVNRQALQKATQTANTGTEKPSAQPVPVQR